MKKTFISILIFASLICFGQNQTKKYYFVGGTIEDWRTIINGLSNCELPSKITSPLIEVINGQVMYQLQKDADSLKSKNDSLKTKRK